MAEPSNNANRQEHSRTETTIDSFDSVAERSEAVRIVLLACAELGWANASTIETVVDEVRAATFDSDESHQELCLWRWLLNLERQGVSRPVLNRVGNRRISRLVQHGIALSDRWSHIPYANQKRWLGARLFAVPAKHLRVGRPALAGLASSRLGKHGRQLPTWPSLLNKLSRWTASHGRVLSLASGTSLYPYVTPLIQRLPISTLTLHCPSAASSADCADDDRRFDSAINWLIDYLQSIDLDAPRANAAEHFHEDVLVSPAWHPAQNTFESLPLQDRVVVCLSDQVHTLKIRRGGTIERLMSERLSDTSWPVGSLYITIADDAELNTQAGIESQSANANQAVMRWLDRGAVGWYCPSMRSNGTFHCEANRDGSPALFQMITRYQADNFGDDREYDTEPRFLVHCVRGNTGPIADESNADFVDRAWQAGELNSGHPFQTLQKILMDGRLIGHSRIARTGSRCVCFSSVPLEQLIARRSFQSHLSRWDWEPYGLLFYKDALHQLGTRRVIYGDEEEFESLTADLQPYFHPAAKRSAKDEQDSWQLEQEWRLLGDLVFTKLPTHATIAFVPTRREAEQLARTSRWPVTYLREN